MIAVMATLKDKQNWERKVFDDEIVQKWRTEALQFGKLESAPEPNASDGAHAQSDDGGDEATYENKYNGESIEFDGSERQKQVSEQMFDYVSTFAFIDTFCMVTEA